MTDAPSPRCSSGSEGLDPCPICKSRLVTLFEEQKGLFVVSCENDDDHFSVQTFGATADEAVRLWNTRDDAQQPQEPVAWRYQFVTSVNGDLSDWFIVDDPQSIPKRNDQVVQPLYASPVSSTEGKSHE